MDRIMITEKNIGDFGRIEKTGMSAMPMTFVSHNPVPQKTLDKYGISEKDFYQLCDGIRKEVHSWS